MLSLFATASTSFVAQPPLLHAAAPSMARVATPPVAVLDQVVDHLPTFQLLSELVDADGERIYGAVDAPGWVAPLGGIVLIGTALLPILLAPGEEAFNQQRGDEETVQSQFGRGRGATPKRRK